MGYACARGQRYLRPWTEVRPPVDGDTAAYIVVFNKVKRYVTETD